MRTKKAYPGFISLTKTQLKLSLMIFEIKDPPVHAR